ncbi:MULTISPECIES: hypothetical protein [unclassified Sphingobacterium]|uniref:hypothetical protein n=1 Tax=unclassified Sphingobacterium TaxID=2609468 RepID=UPI0020C58320|nr:MULTISPECIES: hypothetical protein [unclassified Sphingobacterium]
MEGMRGWTKIMGKNQDGRDERMELDQGMNQDEKDRRMDQDHGIEPGWKGCEDGPRSWERTIFSLKR